MNRPIERIRENFKIYDIDGYIIPSSDEYQNEYTPLSSKGLQFITGFTGSNGLVIITKDKSYFFTDKRYLLQSKKEIPDDFEIHDISSLSDFKIMDKLGYNPFLFTEFQIRFWFRNLNIKSVEKDLLDLVWENKPLKPASETYLYPLKYAGLDSVSKLKIIRKEIDGKADQLLLTSPDNICWLLNIRASDIEFSPIMLGRAIISEKEVILFTNLSRIPSSVRNELSYVTFYEEQEIYKYLDNIDKRVMFDPSSCSLGLQNLIKNRIAGVSPCTIHQSCKNKAEIEYAKEGHIKDAVALCEAFAWLVDNKEAITEHNFSAKLTYFRTLQEGYVMDSFPAIVGFNDNGAIIHYRPSDSNSKLIKGDGVLLIDSGAHYLGCTTDVTRNIVFGKADSEVKIRYTQVLKGHIKLSMQIFPEGTYGSNLDVLARMYLWRDEVDYGHGTGHGVGNFLNVHEKPASIRQSKADTPLKEGMIVSNEPGFYKDGEYGIRIENLMYIKESHKGFLEFETLTLVPYCKDLIDFSMLDKDEYDYLINYYDNIKTQILPRLSDKAKKWLIAEVDLS